MRKIQKILLDPKTQKTYAIKTLDDDFHTASGVIVKEDLAKEGIVKSDKGKKFIVLKPTFADLWKGLARGPQVMIQKDIGMILAKTGVNKASICVDAGGGSGSLCLSLANVCKHVTSFEVNPEHYDVIQRNMKLFGITNLDLIQGSIYKGISVTDVDLVTLDLPQPHKAIEPISKVLKTGGHVVVYLPNLLQLKTFLESCKGTAIRTIETIELMERKWKIEGQIMRPEFEMLGHTGFLTFCRKF